MLEMSNPVFLEKNKKNIISLLSAVFAGRVVKVKIDLIVNGDFYLIF